MRDTTTERTARRGISCILGMRVLTRTLLVYPVGVRCTKGTGQASHLSSIFSRLAGRLRTERLGIEDVQENQRVSRSGAGAIAGGSGMGAAKARGHSRRTVGYPACTGARATESPDRGPRTRAGRVRV